MRFRGRDYERQLVKVGWWLQLADYWNERDPKFAELLRTKAREIQRAEDGRAKTLWRRLSARADTAQGDTRGAQADNAPKRRGERSAGL